MSRFAVEVKRPEKQHAIAAIRHAKAAASDRDDRDTHDLLSEVRDAIDAPAGTTEDGVTIGLSTEQIEAFSNALADYGMDGVDGAESPEFNNVATRIFRYVEHGPDYDPSRDTGMQPAGTETADDGSTVLRVEYGDWEAAKNARDEHSRHISEQDDRRFKTVVFNEASLSPGVVKSIEADADEDVAASETRSHSEPLTDAERSKVKEADGFSQTVTTANWRSAKGVFTREGMGDRFRDAIGALTDGDDPAELAESWVRDAKQGREDGQTAVSGGGRDVGEEDINQRRRQQAAAQVVMSEEFDNARRWCKKGDKDACDALVEEFDISRSEAMEMLGIAEDTTTEDTTEQRDLVTVGGDGDFPEMQITEAAAGALRDSWTSYKTATGSIEDAIETIREEVSRGRRSMEAINAIREAGGQDEIEAEKLGAQLGALAELPGSIPQMTSLAEFGIFENAGYADTTRQPPLDVDTTDINPRGRTPETGIDAPESADVGAWEPRADGYGVGGTSGKAIHIEDTGKPGVHHVQLIPETGGSITVAMNLRRREAETVANRLANGLVPATIGHGGERLTRAVRSAFVDADPSLIEALTDRFQPRSLPLDIDTTTIDPRGSDGGTEERDRSELVEVRSPFRPLPRAARKALSQDFGGIEELEPAENHRGGGYLVPERPPESFLDKHELKVIRDPVVSYETDHGDVVDIYADPDRVIAGGTETNLSAVEAVQNAESEDRFTLTAGDPSNVPGWPPGRSTPLDAALTDARPARRRRRQTERDAENAREFRRVRRDMADRPIPDYTSDRFQTLRQEDEFIEHRGAEWENDPTPARHRDADVAPTQEETRDFLNAVRRAEAQSDWERLRELRERHEARLSIDPRPVPGRTAGRSESGDSAGRFSVEQQQTFGGPEPEQEAQNEQVTLTGETEGTDDARPARWTAVIDRSDRLQYDGGPVNVAAVRDDDAPGATSWEVYVTEGSNMETIASDIKSGDHAKEIADEFRQRLAPPEVSLHNANSAVPEAAAEAKAAAVPEDEGLGRFGGGPGN